MAPPSSAQSKCTQDIVLHCHTCTLWARAAALDLCPRTTRTRYSQSAEHSRCLSTLLSWPWRCSRPLQRGGREKQRSGSGPLLQSLAPPSPLPDSFYPTLSQSAYQNQKLATLSCSLICSLICHLSCRTVLVPAHASAHATSCRAELSVKLL